MTGDSRSGGKGWVNLGLILLAGAFVLGVSTEFGFVAPGGKRHEGTDSQPRQIIEEYKERTIHILEKTRKEELSEQRMATIREELVQTLSPIVNFHYMTQSALGPHSRRITDRQLVELVSVFKPLVVRLYTDRMFSYLRGSGNAWELKSIEILEEERRYGGKYAQVKTRVRVLLGGKEQTFSLDFRMTRRDGKWQVYDIVVEGVSLVENYRSQFSETLANHSFEYLVNLIRDKLKEAKSSGPSPDRRAMEP